LCIATAGARSNVRGRTFRRMPCLHFPKRTQRWLAVFLEFVKEQSGPRPLAEWAREAYEPESCEARLDAHGLAGSFEGLFQVTVPRISAAARRGP